MKTKSQNHWKKEQYREVSGKEESDAFKYFVEDIGLEEVLARGCWVDLWASIMSLYKPLGC